MSVGHILGNDHTGYFGPTVLLYSCEEGSENCATWECTLFIAALVSLPWVASIRLGGMSFNSFSFLPWFYQLQQGLWLSWASRFGITLLPAHGGFGRNLIIGFFISLQVKKQTFPCIDEEASITQDLFIRAPASHRMWLRVQNRLRK